MKIEAGLSATTIEGIKEQVRRIETLGFDRITRSELDRDPFLPLTIAAEYTSTVELATSVAIAFPRSPTITAHIARDLNDLSEGRFVLGLGTQVKGHIQRRFATEWSSPGPRFRDYIEAVRAVWDSWDHESGLRHEGSFYQLSLMTPEFSPGPSQYRRPPIQIAGVNRYNLRLAGEVCDGLRVHPFATRRYMEETIWPAVRAGAERSGRDLSTFDMIGGGFIATGRTTEQVEQRREQARYRLAFYASTRTYLPVLETHGWEDLNERLRRLVSAGKWDELAAAVPDEVLDEFCVAGTYEDILPEVRDRYEGLVDAVSLDLPEPSDEEVFQALLGELRNLNGAHD